MLLESKCWIFKKSKKNHLNVIANLDFREKKLGAIYCIFLISSIQYINCESNNINKITSTKKYKYNYFNSHKYNSFDKKLE